jgi:hypothetical protein
MSAANGNGWSAAMATMWPKALPVHAREQAEAVVLTLLAAR